MRIWELSRAMGPIQAAGKAETDVGSPLLDVDWKDDGMHAFGVGCGKTVKLWSLQSNTVQEVGSHDAPIRSCHWVKDKQVLVTAGWDRNVRYWDLRSPTPALSVAMPERVYAVDVKHPVMVVATADKKVGGGVCVRARGGACFMVAQAHTSAGRGGGLAQRCHSCAHELLFLCTLLHDL